MIDIQEYEIEAQFLDFMRLNNCEPHDSNISLQMDGALHRYRLRGDKPGQKTGAYCVFTDGWPAGWCQNWREGCAVSWSFDRNSLDNERKKSLSNKEYQALLDKSKAHQAEMRKQQEQMHNEAADRARILCEQLPEAPYVCKHPYAEKKQIYSYGLRYQKNNNSLVVPLRNIDGRIISLQWINDQGDKIFFPGASTKGAFFSIALNTADNNQNIPILIGEGYATMATIYYLTNMPCIAAMNCGNIKTVAEAVKSKYPNNPILIMADNDHLTDGNPGKNDAEKACSELKLNGVITPEFADNENGTDWNDFFILHGEDFTQKKLMSEINYKKLSEAQRKEVDARKKINSLVKILDPAINLKPQILIGGLFPCGFLSAIVAPPGTGKTMFIQKFVSDLSVGGNIFDGFAEKEPVRTSLIFSGEAGYEIMIRRAAQLKWSVNPKNVLIIDQYTFESADMPVTLDDEDGRANIQRIIDMYKPEIIFFDSLVSFHDKDENKAVDMKPIIKYLGKIAKDKNIAIVLVHHTRKRTAKERSLSLNQDEVIGSSVFNKLIALIVAIEPMKEDEQTLLVRPLKSWLKAFMPFTYKITEDFYKNPIVEIDLAPASVCNTRIAVWNYLKDTFEKGEWFSSSQIILSEIEGNITDRQLRHILASFVDDGKLNRRGNKKYLEYSLC